MTDIEGCRPGAAAHKDKVLITGGAGFLGRHMAVKLAALGHPVTTLDNLLSPNSTFDCPELTNPSITNIEGSVLDEALVSRLVSEHPLIVHMATVVGVEETICHTVPTVENLAGTLNLARSLTADHTVLFTSSADVYGAHSHYYDRSMRESDLLVFENALVNRWVYPHVKALEENLVSNSPAPSVVIRVFNTYGPAMDYPAPKRVVPHFIDRVLGRIPLLLSGDGSQIRSFCYVDDMIAGMTAALNQARSANERYAECFNLGNDEPISIRGLAEQTVSLAFELGLTNQRLEIQENAFRYSQNFDDSWNRTPDIGHAKEVLGYSPKVSLANGLRSTLQYYACLESEEAVRGASSLG